MKQDFNFELFSANINTQISKANKLVDEIEQMSYHQHGSADEEDLIEQKFDVEIFELRHKILFALEFLELGTLLERFNEEYAKYEKEPPFEMIPYIEILHSPRIGLIWNFMNIINCQTQITDTADQDHSYEKSILERILRGTGKLIADRKVLPINEAEVRREVYQTLVHVFPDTVREIPIPQIVKTFKPDIGVKHLKIAIEYKFVDSQEDAKSCLGGIYEDMMGYEGTEDWIIFYAVLYMTDNFYTKDQIEAQFQLSKSKKNWIPIIVFGKGGRKRKIIANETKQKK